MKLTRVNERLWRADQPATTDLEQLHELGIRTIVNLRREEGRTIAAERRAAEMLGMRFLNFRFYGIFGASTRFLDAILAELHRPENGGVLVHCKNGCDRTSLVIGLYRVLFEGWDPDRAWREEFVRHGHDPDNPRSPWKPRWRLWFYANVRRTFFRHLRCSRFAAHRMPAAQNA
jgi:protein tyrosine/serine phosphatase